MRKTKLQVICAVSVHLATAGALTACDVPVFRYALERWPVDPCLLVAVEATPLSAPETTALEELRKHCGKGGLNLQLQVMKAEAFSASAYGEQVSGRVKENRLFLFYPKASGLVRPIWNGPISQGAVGQLAACKDRQTLVRHLLSGSSGVFLLLECGDREKDDKARLLLDATLKKLAKEIKLPVTVAKAGEEGKEVDSINKLESAIPFKVEFTVQTLSKADAKKSGAVLQQMLLGLEADLMDLQKQPMAFLVYGRGRALPPLIGEGINEKMVKQLASFVTGACSCQVKTQNPGTDLLIKQDWDAAVLGKGVK